jgi:hypothetical protein
MLELIAGVLVTFVAVGVVLEPLIPRPGARPAAAPAAEEPEFIDIEESESPKIQALLALKEIEFDRATGKLSDEDYNALKAKYQQVGGAGRHRCRGARGNARGWDSCGRGRGVDQTGPRGEGLSQLRSAPGGGRRVLLRLRAQARGLGSIEQEWVVL